MCKSETNFVHLHVHSEYSTLDGAARVEELITTAKELGQDTITITDHGTTSALFQAQELCDKHDMKLVMGCEFYWEHGSEAIAKDNGHIVVLAKNQRGLENIFRMQEIAYVENFYRKPRINWDILAAHKEGLIVTSACLGSEFNQLIMAGDIIAATQWARKFRDAFQDDFYIELQPNSIPEQHLCNTEGIRIARALGIQLVGTNDVHYALETDCFPHEVLLALQLNKKMSDPKRFRFSTNDFWLKSEEEMVETFVENGVSHDVTMECMRNTRIIADKCNTRIEKGLFIPPFYKGEEDASYRKQLVAKVMEGARETGFISDEPYMKEVQHEIDVIDRNGYSSYFLIVQDYIESAKRNGVIVGDRGSVGGSKVAYLTGISETEPREFDLLFERFLSDGRVPDIDADFSDQDLVFKDLQEKNGADSVARIVTFGRLTPKAVTRKVLNVFEVPMVEIGRITKMISEDCETMSDAYKHAPELLQIKMQYKSEFAVIERLEGIVSHEGVHAGGVIIYPKLGTILPVKTKSEDRNARIVAWDKYMLESLGHQKFDVLGLETLPVIKRCMDSIEETTGERIDLNAIDYEDQRVYDMLCKGHVMGVFQLAAQAGRVVEQQPRNFRDIIAINALIRPGTGNWDEYIARRRGKEWFVDPNRPWMHETQGVMTYQEQFLLDAHKLAGWGVAYADKHIRKNKNIRADHALKEKFLRDTEARGFDEEYALSVWTEIENATGDYSFNKSHSATYGKRSFQTAWLKCNYPAHFYASLMTSQGDDQDKIAALIAECKAQGISINPPDINHGDGNFRVVNGRISYRITTIKHVGEGAIDWIIANRPFSGFQDFIDRRDKSAVKANVVVNLIKAGCFDFDNPAREEVMWQWDMSQRSKTQVKQEYEVPRTLLTSKLKSEWERDSLGMYLSVHPMEKYGFKPFSHYKNEERCLIGGEVMQLDVRADRKGNDMAFVLVNTLYGVLKVLIFSYLWAREDVRAIIKEGSFLLVRGKKSNDSVLFDSGEVLE